jgi:CDP-diacylglycerol--glycerol-3-phosphate 3-phosphatidyltransferase
MHTFKDVNLPNWLTIIRLVVSPLALPLLLVYFLPHNILWLNIGLAFLFVLFGLTDFFDGYLARRFDQETKLGKMLDPIADKFLVYSTLVALLAAGKIFFYWVIIFIGREFFIMGLRSIALEHNLRVPVSFLGKVKTFFQMILLTWIIVNPYQQAGMRAYPGWNGGEFFLLVMTLALTVISAHNYYTAFIIAYMDQQLHDGEPVTIEVEEELRDDN